MNGGEVAVEGNGSALSRSGAAAHEGDAPVERHHSDPHLSGSLTDVPGVRVGHAQRLDDGFRTGVTVVLPPPGTLAAVDVRGGAACTAQTDALRSGAVSAHPHALMLSGGSGYGLAALAGVQQWCAEQGWGFPVGPGAHEVVPVVPAACIFDLGRGGRFDAVPDPALARRAAQDAAGPRGLLPRNGGIGAGTGAAVDNGRGLGGVGGASVRVRLGGGDGEAVDEGGHDLAEHSDSTATPATGRAVTPATDSTATPATGSTDTAHGDRGTSPADPPSEGTPVEGRACHHTEEPPGPGEVVVAALAVVNAYGAPDVPYAPVDGPRADSPLANTTLVVLATSARLERAMLERLAVLAHDGMARALDPVHTLADGDVVFALSTGEVPLPEEEVGLPGLRRWRGAHMALQQAAAEVTAAAIRDAVTAATVTRA